jgi:hypothetical protein
MEDLSLRYEGYLDASKTKEQYPQLYEALKERLEEVNRENDEVKMAM